MEKHTTGDIENNYEFKVMRRILKKEYPFITNITLTDNWDEYISLYFVDITINPIMLMEVLNIPDSTRYIRRYNNSVAYLSMLFHTSFNRDDSISNIAKQVQATMTRVHESPSIPDDMKLYRPVSISGWDVDGQVDTTK